MSQSVHFEKTDSAGLAGAQVGQDHHARLDGRSGNLIEASNRVCRGNSGDNPAPVLLKQKKRLPHETITA